MKLYFSRNYNPRLAVAVARHLNSPVEFELRPLRARRAREISQTQSKPGPPNTCRGEKTLWEADAIACRLSRFAGLDFWPTDDALPDFIWWISWGYWNFVRACVQVHFERVTKQRYGLRPVGSEIIEAALSEFASSAAILEQHFAGRNWLVGDELTYADFRVACVLPFAELAGLPLADFPRVEAWHARLMKIPAWRDPFAGLDAPELPRVRGHVR
jgi:glutathione S-transferase